MVGSKGWGYLYVAGLRQHPRIHLGPAQTTFEPSRPIDIQRLPVNLALHYPAGPSGTT